MAKACAVLFDAGDAAIGKAPDAVGHAGDRRVVRDHDRRSAEFRVDSRDHLEHRLPVS